MELGYILAIFTIVSLLTVCMIGVIGKKDNG